MEWISVNDRVPEDLQVVLCHNKEGFFIACFRHRFKMEPWFQPYDDSINDDPTHWMPLPKPPEEV